MNTLFITIAIITAHLWGYWRGVARANKDNEPMWEKYHGLDKFKK